MDRSVWLRGLVSPFLIVGYFVFISWPATRTNLNPDDALNLYGAWTSPVITLLKNTFVFWTGGVRPVGSLYYRLIYALVGFHPRPFRMTCFLLLVLNVVLAFRLYRLITASRRDSVLAAFFGCFHGAMWAIFASSGTVYDVLCQLFVLTALILYIKGRQVGGIGCRRAVLICLAMILAIASKEMAYTLPLVFVCFELVFHPPSGWAIFPRWVRWHFNVAGLTALISIASWIGRKASNQTTYQLYAYKPLLTLDNILHSLREYLHFLSFKSVVFNSTEAVLVVVLSLVVAVLLRSRVMLFGWLYAMAFAIPILIVPPRTSGYVLYIPFTGCALYLAGAIRCVYESLERILHVNGRRSSFLGVSLRNAILGLALIGITILHVKQRSLIADRDFAIGGENQVRVLANDISRLYPRLRRNDRILLVNDAFGDEQWQPMFVIRLRYRDPSLIVTKMHWDVKSGPLAIPSGAYDHVLLYDGAHYREVVAR
jgi:hypothetical protein